MGKNERKRRDKGQTTESKEWGKKGKKV